MSVLIGVMFFVFLLAGMPIFLVLGLTALGLLQSDGAPLVLLVQKSLDELNTELLLSLPFFGMAASFMERGGTAKALVNFAAGWLGAVRGGLGVVAVAACAIFAAIAGSSVATALAMGTLLVPLMLQRGYPAPMSTGLLASSATLGILIPPSLPMILFAIMAQESVPRLFLAGVVPGILLSLILAGYVLWIARRDNLPAEPSHSMTDLMRVTVRALPALSIPVIIAVGIYGGFVTLTESAVLAALAAFFVGLFVYRGFKISESVEVSFVATKSAASIIIIIAMALTFGHWITVSGFTGKLVDIVTSWDLTAIQFLLGLNVLLFILGMFLEVTSVMLLLVPILVPMLKPLGIDPVHFCVVLVVNMEIAMITPPVGLNLFVISSVSKVSLKEVVKGIWPMVLLFIGFLLLITWFPAISLWLPNQLLGS